MQTHVPFSVVDSSIPAANLNELGLVSLSGTAVIEVTLWDLNQETIDIDATSTEALALSITTTAISLPAAFAAASKTFPANAAGCEIRVVSGAGIAVNLNGTSDGSAGTFGNGFTNAGDVPSAASPEQYIPGQTFKVGRYQGMALIGTGIRVPNVFKSFTAQAITAATPVTIWTPTSGKKFRLLGYSLSNDAGGHMILKDNTAAILTTPDAPIGGPGVSSPPMGEGILSAAANNTLKVDVSATGNVSGYVFGSEE